MVLTHVLKHRRVLHKTPLLEYFKTCSTIHQENRCLSRFGGSCFPLQKFNSTEAANAESIFSPERIRLIKTARGGYANGTNANNNRLLKVFPLRYHNVPSIANPILSPSQFHSQICQQIRAAKRRVILASLYIGPAAGSDITATTTSYDSKEHELLSSLAQLTSSSNVDVKILLDRNRALRKVPIKSTDPLVDEKKTITSASACYRALRHAGTGRKIIVDSNPSVSQQSAEVYLISILPKYLQMSLPSPLNEIAGVFHIKCYIVDDDMILTGANLSEEYFTDRTDRYLWIRGDGTTWKQSRPDVDAHSNRNCGLVECYADMINLLCRSADLYEETETGEVELGAKDNSRLSRIELIKALHKTLTVESHDNQAMDTIWMETDVMAVAIPTFQSPKSYVGLAGNPIPSDVNTMCKLIEETTTESTEIQRIPTLRLSTAYLNPTNQLLNAIKKFPFAVFLSAGKISHGFRPKTQRKLKETEAQLHGFKRSESSKRTDWIPSVFDELAREAMLKLQNAEPHVSQLWFYQRTDWTFHAKGIWLTYERDRTPTSTIINNVQHRSPPTQTFRINDAATIAAVTVGSSNYGGRSDRLDMESNVILFFPDRVKAAKVNNLQQLFTDEWNSLADFAVLANTQHQSNLSKWLSGWVVPICRYFF